LTDGLENSTASELVGAAKANREKEMFERYTEKARRVIFFARYETSQLGARSIETKHLLLGLLREDTPLVRRFLPPADSIEAVRRDVQERVSRYDLKVPTSVDLPLSEESKRVLMDAAEDAEALSNKQIDTAHLLLRLLREEGCVASKILLTHGLEYSAVLTQLEGHGSSLESDRGQSSTPIQGFVPDKETAVRIAEAVWIVLYGKKGIELKKPYKVELENEMWTVTGTYLDQSTSRVATARISKADGRILRVALDE
jgi:ATP-dependent Clp protease ATP-binding subunit ClpA